MRCLQLMAHVSLQRALAQSTTPFQFLHVVRGEFFFHLICFCVLFCEILQCSRIVFFMLFLVCVFCLQTLGPFGGVYSSLSRVQVTSDGSLGEQGFIKFGCLYITFYAGLGTVFVVGLFFLCDFLRPLHLCTAYGLVLGP